MAEKQQKEMKQLENLTLQIKPVGTPDEVAEKLDKILGDVQLLIHDQWDWMKAHFYVDCLRSMANDERDLLAENQRMRALLQTVYDWSIAPTDVVGQGIDMGADGKQPKANESED